jgi:Ca2+-binding RTX toxin-like protein
MRRPSHSPYLPPDLPAAPWSPLDTEQIVAPALTGTQVAPVAAEVKPAAVDVADVAVNGPQARSAFDVTGAGLRIGILSDSYNLLGGAAADIQAGLLPADGVDVLKEGPAGSADEGRAMAEIVHATAPGAQLYFYTAFDSEQDFANGIAALQAAGCQIIVDDTTYPDEPMFQVTGPVDTAVQNAVAEGTDYFTAAGNEGSAFYQAALAPTDVAIAALNRTVDAQTFSNGTPYQTIDIPAGFSTTLTLEWAAPYGTATADSITVYAIASNDTVLTSTQSGQEPDVTIVLPAKSFATTYQIVIAYNAGTPEPTQFKYVLEGGGSIDDPQAGIGSGSAIGHALVPGVNVVGAVDVSDTPSQGGTPSPESYSSTGPGEILYTPNGTPLATPQSLAIPSFLAPDGAATSVFDPFFGTSAAAPVAAATAALMLQAQPALTTGDVTALLEDSAIPSGAASVAGAGLIQANLAVQYAATGLISGSQQTVITGTSRGGTIQGGAAAQWIDVGSGATSVQSVAADTILAGAGADTVDLAGVAALLYGNTGPLLVTAFDGSDTVAGASGSVTVLGGIGGGSEIGGTSGNNLLVAGDYGTTLVAGGPNDTLEAAGGGGDVLVAGTTGAALLTAGGSTAGNVFIATGSGNDTVQTGPGDNTTYLGSGRDAVSTDGADTVVGGTGIVVLAVASGRAEYVNGSGSAVMTPGAGSDTLVGGTGSVTLLGGAGTPLAFGGSAGGNLLQSGSGASTLIGGGANDTIIGAGNGDLLLASEGGGDTVQGGTGTEILVGGEAGTNVFQLGASNALVAPLASTAVIVMGSGESTVQTGSAAELLDFTSGQAGGLDFVEGFNPAADMLLLNGYDQPAVAQSVSGQYDTGGNSWLALPDGTVVAFLGLDHFSAGNLVFG